MKDLEKLVSVDWFSSQDPQSRSSWSHSGLKTKRGSQKQEKRKTSDRRSPSDSPHSLSRPLEMKESRGSRIKEAGPAEAKIQNSDIQELQCLKLLKHKLVQETIAGKLHKLESRKGVKREAPGPEHEAGSRWKRESEHEHEEKRRKRRSELTESFPIQVKKFGSKHLEKTVSIRLVDIRTSEPDGSFLEKGTTKRSSASLDGTTNPKDAADGCARNSSHSSHGAVGGHLKGWGKFRIPRRSEKPPAMKEPEAPEQQQLLLRPLTNAPEASYPRTRLRTGAENDGYDPKAGDDEVEPCLKRCHSHQLRGGGASLSRRYGSDIIRRGVLAS